MIPEWIERYKRMRTEHFLRQKYQYQYAFVGMGQHSLVNLYPALHHLGVQLRCICVATERKARLIGERFPGIRTTTSLGEVLSDSRVKGVFVAASPSAHFRLASQVLESGKALFIEKPPCRSLAELDELLELQRQHASPIAMVGMQQRFAPAIGVLRRKLRHRDPSFPLSYSMHYLTGAYPEGDALLDLFIHPLDLACHLFGRAQVASCQRAGRGTLVLMLRHPGCVGTMELSTDYSWTDAAEELRVLTPDGAYRLEQAEQLTFAPRPARLIGIPIEKLNPHASRTRYIYYNRNGMVPTAENNPVFSQGFYDELRTFVHAVERGTEDNRAPLSSLRDTFKLIEELRTGILGTVGL